MSENELTIDNKDEKLRRWQRKITIAVLLLVASFLLFQVAIFFVDILRIIGVSILIAYLIINLVDFINRFVPRAVAIVIVYIVLAILLAAGLVLLVPAIVYQVTQLAETTVVSIPTFIEWLTNTLMSLEQKFSTTNFHFKALDFMSAIASHIPTPDTGLIFDRVSGAAMSTMTWLVYAISVAVTGFYLLLDGHKIKNRFISWFPANKRSALQQMAADMDKSLQSFLRGQIVLGLGIGIVMMIVYSLLGVHYALLLGLVLAAWEVVPVIGPPLGFLPAIISVLIHGMDHCPGNRIVECLILTAVFCVLQQVKDNVVAPRYIGNVIGIHPILIFIAIMVGARLDGIMGIIFALPAACVINVMVNHLPLKTEPTEIP
ncbi:MAG: AI-2E family transporter [Candidatus Obscuribacterales bacterium]|nr:AI-2E family transporter [Candidatus Obscuribacterales bacterium]